MARSSYLWFMAIARNEAARFRTRVGLRTNLCLLDELFSFTNRGNPTCAFLFGSVRRFPPSTSFVDIGHGGLVAV